MVDTTNGEKRRPGCCAPAKAWYSESPYCIAHVPIPRGQAEEQRRLEAERKREEDARKVLRSFDDDRSEVAPSNLTHIPDDHMITRDRNGNVIEVPDPLAF